MHAICTVCGTQFAERERPPERCPVCEDTRQFIGGTEQRWTTLVRLRAKHGLALREQGDGLLGLGAEPTFARGQRALLVLASPDVGGTGGRNLLWDCISLLDDAAVRVIAALGGLAAIAISQPHSYAAMVEWSHAFGGVPVYLHAADRAWVMRPDPAIVFWDGDALEIGPGLTLVRLGGHFAGGTVLHWAGAAAHRGALLTGDILQVMPDRHWVSFMHGFPTRLPLPAAIVRRMAERLEPYRFERVYSARSDAVVAGDGKAVVQRSVERHIRAFAGA